MFHLIAAIFLVAANGQPADAPTARLVNHHVFQSEDECMNYFDTAAGKRAYMELEAMIKSSGEPAVAKYSCEAVEAPKDTL